MKILRGYRDDEQCYAAVDVESSVAMYRYRSVLELWRAGVNYRKLSLPS